MARKRNKQRIAQEIAEKDRQRRNISPTLKTSLAPGISMTEEQHSRFLQETRREAKTGEIREDLPGDITNILRASKDEATRKELFAQGEKGRSRERVIDEEARRQGIPIPDVPTAGQEAEEISRLRQGLRPVTPGEVEQAKFFTEKQETGAGISKVPASLGALIPKGKIAVGAINTLIGAGKDTGETEDILVSALSNMQGEVNEVRQGDQSAYIRAVINLELAKTALNRLETEQRTKGKKSSSFFESQGLDNQIIIIGPIPSPNLII